MKGKPLLPTLKTKKRYVHYIVYAETPLSHHDIYQAIETTFLAWFGKMTYAKAGMQSVKSLGENQGIIKINTKYLNHMHFSMAMTKTIKKHDVLLTAINVSGILKKIGGYKNATTTASNDGL